MHVPLAFIGYFFTLQEVVCDFDLLSHDALSVVSEEELPPPPLSSSTNLMGGASTELLLPVSSNSNR